MHIHTYITHIHTTHMHARIDAILSLALLHRINLRKNRLKKKKKNFYANIQYSRTSMQSQHGDLHDYKTVIHVKLVRKIGRRDI